MNRALVTALAVVALSGPVSALTSDNGVVLITQADALVGSVTPGDTPGFPITISAAGSYRFASNLLVSTGVDGIEVTTPEVTIDMAGFRMAGSGIGVNAIAGEQRSLTVVNGTIRGFVNAIKGVDSLTVKRMRIVDNQYGISGADFMTVSASNISRHANYGIQCGSFCRIRQNIISANASSNVGVAVVGSGGLLVGNILSGSGYPVVVVVPHSASFGDNTVLGNVAVPQGTLLPLDPNQPPPPP